MWRSGFRQLAVVALCTLGAASAARANFVFGSFEGDSFDGFESWSSAGPVPIASDTTGTKYSFTSSGATNGTVALDVNHTGFAQDLSFDFVSNGDEAQFLANDVLSFDLTDPVSSTNTGFWQIFAVSLNAPGAGFQNVPSSPTPLFNVSPPYTGTTHTISINYDAFKSAITANPGYTQMVIAVNDGSGAPADFFFDNFQLSQVPEPASCSLLAMGAAGLLFRRRRN